MKDFTKLDLHYGIVEIQRSEFNPEDDTLHQSTQQQFWWVKFNERGSWHRVLRRDISRARMLVTINGCKTLIELKLRLGLAT